MRVGFTGTREGMTNEQAATVSRLLVELEPEWGHHGDCIGADAGFHRLAIPLGIKTKGHPPANQSKRAFCNFDEVAIPKGYYARNRDIVKETDLLIATPKESEDQTSGGTWYTVGYASTVKKRTLIVWPDGTTEPRNEV